MYHNGELSIKKGVSGNYDNRIGSFDVVSYPNL